MFKKSKKYIIIFFLILSIFLLFGKSLFPVYVIDEQTVQYKEIKKKIDLNKKQNFLIQNNNSDKILNGMFLAKKYILKNDFNKAFTELNNCLKYTEEENLKNILKLRMAKIKIQKNEYEIALNILNTIKTQHWMNIIENIKGDIFVEINKKKEAIQCWKKSLSIESYNASKEIIKMKINELK